MQLIFLCGIAVFTIYYFTYLLFKKKTKFRSQIAIIPTLISAIGFVWLIIDRQLIIIIYILYGLAIIIIFTYAITSFIKKNILLPVIALILSIVSVYILYWVIKETYFNSEQCDVVDGCMNEIGMLMVISYFFMAISFFVVVLSHIVEISKLKKNRIDI
jgi:hypothetical protein